MSVKWYNAPVTVLEITFLKNELNLLNIFMKLNQLILHTNVININNIAWDRGICLLSMAYNSDNAIYLDSGSVLNMTETSANNGMGNVDDEKDIFDRIEKAYSLYKMSEVFLNDVRDDYGKLKIARLRLEFARHELECVLSEARERGIKLDDNELVKDFYQLE